MEPSEIHSYLNSFVNFESKLHQLGGSDFSLNRIKKFLDLAGNPQQHLKIVHVAGTKGKGSTCAFLAQILQEAGYKVGLYTSPHLHHVNERIRVLEGRTGHKDDFNGAIPDEEFASVLAFLRPFAAAIQNEGDTLTYFEVLTVAALCHFARAKVDVVILETGLGGRLDATNAAASLVAVITPVSLDHMQILGGTLVKIAAEKAGIIKNSHQRVVVAPQELEAMEVILHRCKEFGVKPTVVHPEKYSHLKIGLKGGHQKVNAATAVEAALILKALGFNISEKAVSEGLKNVFWPGRFELLGKKPDIVADGAHNGASARSLSTALTEEYPGRRVILVLGTSKDKDIPAICQTFKDQPAYVILTKANHPRSHVFTPAEALSYWGAKPFEIIEHLPEALARALQVALPQDIIVVTGSLFIVAEARLILSRTQACTNTKD